MIFMVKVNSVRAQGSQGSVRPCSFSQEWLNDQVGEGLVGTGACVIKVGCDWLVLIHAFDPLPSTEIQTNPTKTLLTLLVFVDACVPVFTILG